MTRNVIIVIILLVLTLLVLSQTEVGQELGITNPFEAGENATNMDDMDMGDMNDMDMDDMNMNDMGDMNKTDSMK
ncbi:MAG: hypothetical protein ACON4W_00135 [Parvibaculales bacterium]